MASEIMSGLAIFNTMLNMAKALKDIDNAVSRNAAVIELQEQIFSAHAAQAALVGRISDLGGEVRRLETWEREKQRYELHEVKEGRFTRRLKESMTEGEPAHDICANCYNRGIKSILQAQRSDVGQYRLLVCGTCKASLNLTLAG